MIYLFLGVSLLYVLLVVPLIIVWSTKHKTSEFIGQDKVTVIIPVRNEAVGIKVLLEDIEKQNLPLENFEVVVIDDHSNDETESVVNLFINQSPLNLRYLTLPKEQFGKKAAITLGVQESKGRIILSTDGDCRVPTQWVATMLANFKASTQLVAGPVAYQKSRTILGEILRSEFLSLIGVGGGSISFGYPNMVNGANMAYRKSAFLAVNGFKGNEHILTGDDEFLTQKIRRSFHNSVKFVFNADALALTSGPKSIFPFFSQRKRWASKWKHHPTWVKLIALFIFIFYAFYLYIVVLSLSSSTVLNLFTGTFICKLFLDAWFIKSVAKRLEQPVNWLAIFLLELLYPFYAVFFGIYANFGSYNWKGRTSKI